jgi:deoxyribodipyrimidine photolyase-related protein
MPRHVTLIYPHQLYSPPPFTHADTHYVMIEDPLFFGDARYPVRFHKMKLAYHRATMRRYYDEVLYGHERHYRAYHETGAYGEDVFAWLAEQGYTDVHVIDPTDWVLSKRIQRYTLQYGLTLHEYDSPNFLTTRTQLDEFWQDKSADDYHQTAFYIWQRQRLGILLEDEGKPLGGRWTYDTDNRKKLGKDAPLPAQPMTFHNRYIYEARAYVEQHWANNPGSTESFIYPTNADEAEQMLGWFLHHKLEQYGTYQDAITNRDPFLFHSLLSAPLNVGLLDVQHVLDETLAYHTYHPETRLESVEGFVRQVIGWREFMRAVYVRDGVRQRTSNFFGNERTLDESWYTGKTGIQPLDDVLEKIGRYAYAHHIERLMLLGNFMLLAEVHPDEVYTWFMAMFIDAYDWVMVPNVYGMSQYADGGLITTKPYISSSNYVRKMSDYKREAWADTWDGLYWRFIAKHRDFFQSNARLSMMTSHLKRMGDDKFNAHIAHAEAYLGATPVR